MEEIRRNPAGKVAERRSGGPDQQSGENYNNNKVDIEKEFNLKNPTVTGIINRLEEKGYIKRVRSDKDKRYNKLELTESGREILNKGKRKAQENEEKLLKILTDDEIKELKRILTKIVNNI